MIWELSQDLYSGRQPLLEAIGEAERDVDSVPSNPVIVYNFELYNNYPNPFNPSTRIEFEISAIGHVTLRVYDVLGREVATLVDGQRLPGKYEAKFDGGRFSSGVYFCTLTSNGSSQTKKMLLLK